MPQAGEEERADGNVYPSESRRSNYKRFEDTASGISPRAIPGMEGYIFTTTGLEHTEAGLPDYTPDNHMKMSSKRHRKIQGALEDLPQPAEYLADGRLSLGLVAWGSTFGAALEAVQKARKEGLKVGALKITSLFPFHRDVIQKFMAKCDEILIPELNFEGQLANLIGHLHHKDVLRLNRVTGVPLSAFAILEKIKEILE